MESNGTDALPHRQQHRITPPTPTPQPHNPPTQTATTAPSTPRIARVGLVCAAAAAGFSSPSALAFLLPKPFRTTNIMAASSSPTLPAMEGTLFTYYRDEYVNRVAFRSGNPAHKRHVVLVGGLGDGA